VYVITKNVYTAGQQRYS